MGGRVAAGRARARAAVVLPFRALLCYAVAHSPLRFPHSDSVNGVPPRGRAACLLCPYTTSHLRLREMFLGMQGWLTHPDITRHDITRRQLRCWQHYDQSEIGQRSGLDIIYFPSFSIFYTK